MSNALKFAAGTAVAAPLFVDDLFVSYVRTGMGASATVTTGIDLSTSGGLIWSKSRSAATGHRLQCTAIGVGTELITETTGASAAAAQGVTSVSTTGHVIGTDTDYNNNTVTYVDWVMRNADRFFNHASVVKSAGSNATVSFPELTTLGMVAVKRTDAAGSWYVWHRSLTAGKLLYLEQTAAEATLGHITVSGTTVTLVNGVITDGTYIVYAWAHDTEADGIIQCGTFTMAGANQDVTLGWEPQYVLIKDIGGSNDWSLHDSSRVLSQMGRAELKPNAADSEGVNATNPYVKPFATGFTVVNGVFFDRAHIYLAIRRPNKPPTVGTQVYNAIARTGTGAAATVTGVGFAPDLVIGKERGSTGAPNFTDRLRGATYELLSSGTAAEAAFANDLTSFTMDGFVLGSGASGQKNTNTSTYIEECLKRAPGFFDEVCYTGDGVTNRDIAHGLGVIPELWIVKRRAGTGGVYGDEYTEWNVGLSSQPTWDLQLCSTQAKQTNNSFWGDISPTASTFRIGSASVNNAMSNTYVAYLFATLAGISKVGSYTGNGSSQTIACGFTTGARFILIKRTNSTGDWFVWDSVRGIVAGTDPHLSLNTTAAEVTTDDSVDPDTSGFIVNQLAATNINVTSAAYIFLAIA